MLAARHGLGRSEASLVTAEFRDAIHWAVYAEKLTPLLEDARQTAATDPPRELMGSMLTEFIARRARARDRVTSLEAALFPPDEAGR